MLDQRRDYLMRQIQELAQFVARLVGLTEKSAWAEAEKTLAEAYQALLGLPKGMLERLDLATLTTLVNGADRLELTAKLVDEEAKIRRAEGNAVAATRLDERAQRLREHAAAVGDKTA